MEGFLRQSTAGQVRTIGPFIDDTDFKSVENGLTIANTDIKLKKNGATAVNKNAGGGTSDVNGMYQVTWDATDSNTVGELEFSVLVAGALVVWGTYTVLEEAVYDALFDAGAEGPAVPSDVPTAAENADAVWDEDLTTHTIADSTGQALADIDEKGDHAAVLVYYSVANGTPGGTGSFNDPISDETNAIARLAALETQNLIIQDGAFTVPVAQVLDNISVASNGLDSAVNMNGQSVSGARFEGVNLSGEQGGTNEITVVTCVLNGVTNFNGTASTSVLNGTVTIGSRGVGYFINCASLDGGTPATINYQNSNNATTGIVGWQGALIMAGLGSNDPLTNININGTLEFNATNTSNTTPVVVTGSGSIIDNSGVGFTFDDDQFLKVTAGFGEVSVEAWDGVEAAVKVGATTNLPQTNAEAIRDSTDAADRLRDFAIEGYDSVSNQVNGVKLVDVTTTNTDMRGTDGAATPAQVNAEVVDTLNVDTYPEPVAVPAATASIVDKLGWLQLIHRNKGLQTATVQTIRNDGDTADVGTANVSLVPGTSFQRDEWT